jgi:hypothetical protein
MTFRGDKAMSSVKILSTGIVSIDRRKGKPSRSGAARDGGARLA